jgi:hypothetical protein
MLRGGLNGDRVFIVRQTMKERQATSTAAQNSSFRSAGSSLGGMRPRCSRSHMRRLFSAQPSLVPRVVSAQRVAVGKLDTARRAEIHRSTSDSVQVKSHAG